MFTDNTTKTTAKKFIRDAIKEGYNLKLRLKGRFSGYTDGIEAEEKYIDINKEKIDFNNKKTWNIECLK